MKSRTTDGDGRCSSEVPGMGASDDSNAGCGDGGDSSTSSHSSPSDDDSSTVSTAMATSPLLSLSRNDCGGEEEWTNVGDDSRAEARCGS